MLAVFRQSWANLRSRKLQITLVLVTLLAAATLLTVTISTLLAAQGAYNRLWKRTHGAHLWLDLDPKMVTARKAERVLADLPGVVETTGAMESYILLSSPQRSDGWADIQRLREWREEGFSVNRPVMVAGRAPHSREKDAILLDRNVASNADVEVGDTVAISTPDGERSLTVVGLFVTAEWCPYFICQPAPSYLAPGAMGDLGLLPSTVPGAESLDIGLRLRDPADLGRVKRAAEEALPDDAIVDWHTWEHARDLANFTLLFQRVFLAAFSVVAGLAAGFLIANTVGEAVRSQTRQVGLLKAVGFVGRQLAFVYLVESSGPALVAGVSGLALGSWLSPRILRSVLAQFGETAVAPPLWIAFVIPLCVLLVAALFTLWAVRRAIRLDVVTAIREGAEPPHRRAYRLPHRLLPLAMGVSDALSRPRRSLLMTLGLGMAALTLTVALTSNAYIQAFTADPQMGIIADGDLFLSRSVYLGDAKVRGLIARQPDVTAHYTEVMVDFDLPDEQDEDDMDLSPYALRIRGGEIDAFEFPLLEGRMFGQPGEAVVGYGLARDQNLTLGDTFTILVEDRPLELKVVGIYREIQRLGLLAIVSPETVRRILPDVRPYGYWLKLRPGADMHAIAEALEEKTAGLLNVTVLSEEGLPEMVTAMEGVMGILSLVLGIVGAIGVFITVWMGVRERQREFGLLKAVGMTPGQIAVSVLAGACLLALAGYVIGLPSGVGLYFLLMNTVGQMVGFGPNYASPPLDWTGMALTLPGVLLVAVIGALIPARRAGRVSVVEALRYE